MGLDETDQCCAQTAHCRKGELPGRRGLMLAGWPSAQIVSGLAAQIVQEVEPEGEQGHQKAAGQWGPHLHQPLQKGPAVHHQTAQKGRGLHGHQRVLALLQLQRVVISAD